MQTDNSVELIEVIELESFFDQTYLSKRQFYFFQR